MLVDENVLYKRVMWVGRGTGMGTGGELEVGFDGWGDRMGWREMGMGWKGNEVGVGIGGLRLSEIMVHASEERVACNRGPSIVGSFDGKRSCSRNGEN